MSRSKPWVSNKSVSESGRRAPGGGGERRRALLALAVLTLASHGLLSVAEASQVDSTVKSEDEEESDNAPFAVVVQHDMELGSAWYCAGSLVSVRTALTSRWCARGRELWVLATAQLGAPHAPGRMDSLRRVRRVVFANELGGLLPGEMDNASDVVTDDVWSGASLDIALLEMENPFGIRANVRAILMATASSDCGVPNECHVAGVRPRGARVLLRIVDLDMARGDTCADIARHWAAVREYVLCLSGNELCQSDRGAGVVCNGKLCGVMSRSARAGLVHAKGCGDIHAAQSLPRWRRFVQCAHNAGSCSKDTECTELCMERQLLPEAVSPAESQTSRMLTPPPPPPPAPPGASLPEAHSTSETAVTTSEAEHASANTETPDTTAPPYFERMIEKTHRKERGRTRLHSPREETPPTRSEPPPLSSAAALMHPPRMEYDPSRADFKAGEYGDNAADYAGLGEDPGAGVGKTSSSSPSSSSRRSSSRSSSAPMRPRASTTSEPHTSPTRSRLPKTTRFVPPTAENQAAAAELFPGSPADEPSFKNNSKETKSLEEEDNPIRELQELSVHQEVAQDDTPNKVVAQVVAPTRATSACTKRPNIFYSTFCFTHWLVLIKIIY